LLFFLAALFVAIGGLEASGVLGILAYEIAAVASAIVDNIPFTIVLVPVIQQLGELGSSPRRSGGRSPWASASAGTGPPSARQPT